MRPVWVRVMKIHPRLTPAPALLLLFLMPLIPVRAADPLKVPLWPGGAPGATGAAGAHQHA